MRDKIIKRLDVNFRKNTELIIDDFIEEYKTIASGETNLPREDVRLEPHIISAVIKAYIRMGNEGISSSNESGFSVTYEDIEEKLRKNVKSLRVLP